MLNHGNKLKFAVAFLLSVLMLVSCSSSTSTLRIGDYTYKVKRVRINTGTLLNPPQGKFGVPGDFSTFKWIEKGDSLPIISHNKMIYFRGKIQCGCSIKSQKMNREQKTDSIYQKGRLYVLDNLLICVEKYYNGYRQNQIIITINEQQKNGKLWFKKIIKIPADEYRKQYEYVEPWE